MAVKNQTPNSGEKHQKLKKVFLTQAKLTLRFFP